MTSAEGIYGFKGPNRWASNFEDEHSVPYYLLGQPYMFKSGEEAYQAAKALTFAAAETVISCRTPGQAKRAGNAIHMTSGEKNDWDRRKKRIMMEIQLSKYGTHEDLRAKLVATGQCPIVEVNGWGDDFWGAVALDHAYRYETKLPVWGGMEYHGHNYLGRILMAVRIVFRED